MLPRLALVQQLFHEARQLGFLSLRLKNFLHAPQECTSCCILPVLAHSWIRPGVAEWQCSQ
jgi:hypothetical protein